MAPQNYIVMEGHRKFWRYLLTTEDMKSEWKFWIIWICQALNVSCMFRAAAFVEGIPRKVEITGPALCWAGGMTTYALAFLHHRTIFDIVSELQQHYDRHKDNLKDRVIIMACHGEGYLILSLYTKAVLCCTVSFIGIPFLVYAFQYFTGEDAEIELPFDAAYPWESSGLMFYVSFAVQVSLMSCVMPMVIVDTSASVFFCMAAVSYLQLAKETFRDIPEDCNQEEGVRLLKIALRSHQEALKMIRVVESVESVKLFSLVFTTAAALSMLLLACTKAGELGVIVPLAVLAVCVVMQLGLICYYGQKIINEGDKLYEEIYAVPWYNYSKQFRSLLIICLMRAARSDRLTAWGFADISMVTFNRVMTTAFSYVTFLQAMSE